MAALCALCGFLRRVQVYTGIFLIPQHFINLRVFDGLSPLAGDPGCVQLSDYILKSCAVLCCCENPAHIRRFQLVDDILLVYHVITKRRTAAVV